eukprot:1418111-Pyramimonas_sp.AAC.1
MELKAIIAESLEGKEPNVQYSLPHRGAAMIERTREMTRSMGMESFPYVEKELDKLPKFSQFDMPLLSQETPMWPVMQPHYSIPGPAVEGPAMPGTSENSLPINADFTGTIDNMTFVNYHPFTKDGPVKPPTAKPSGGNKDHAPAAAPTGGAGHDKYGGGSSTAP